MGSGVRCRGFPGTERTGGASSSRDRRIFLSGTGAGCSATRPPRFLRGNLRYDEALVGFEWSTRPAARYSPNESLLVKDYDTTVDGKANGGHTFGSGLCPDTSGLDPVRDRAEIQTRILQSPAGALLEYLKTL